MIYCLTETMDYTTTINNFINDRYKYLLTCAKNIMKNNMMGVTAEELLSELTIHLLTSPEKIQEYIDMGKLEAFCVSWMNIQGKYKTSPLNSKYNCKTYELDEVKQEMFGDDDEHLEKVTLSDYEKDLLVNFTPEQINKIKNVNEIYPLLSKSEKILFEAYFIENLSYDKIVKRYTFFRDKDGKIVKYKSKKSIYNLMKGLKEKINYLLNERI